MTNEELEQFDMEFFLERESVPYRVTRGVNGEQLQIQTCPECGDSRWRVYFGTDTGLGNCFVCSSSFNKISFVHAYYQHDFWGDTFRAMSDCLREQGWRPKRKAMVKTEIGEVKLPVSEQIPNEQGVVHEYLARRGMTAELCQYFQLRICEFGWWMFKEENETKMQDFSNRIIIPVFDLDGTLKTFQGRDITGTSDRKYLFPKALPGTGRYLLNGHNCVASSRAVMGEGFFDVAAIKMAFDDDVSLRDVTALGSFGKHLSYGDLSGNDQLGRYSVLKARGLREVTVMWDGEVNALKAALDAARRLRGIGLKAKIALLPFDHDPNEVSPDIVRRAFYGAHDYSDALHMKWSIANPYATERLRKQYGV